MTALSIGSGLRLATLLAAGLVLAEAPRAQDQPQASHRRGHLWETVSNTGFIGDGGAWDFLTPRPMGLFPGFKGFTHPVGGEQNAIDTYANANMHNFHSGVWIGVKDLNVPGPPPDFRPTAKPFEIYASGGQVRPLRRPGRPAEPPARLQLRRVGGLRPAPARGVDDGDVGHGHRHHRHAALVRLGLPRLPRLRSLRLHVHQHRPDGLEPDGRGRPERAGLPADPPRASTSRSQGAVSVSTKSQINFHTDLLGIAAGAFGYQIPAYHDFYHQSADRTLAYSTNYNGGVVPTPFDVYPIKEGQQWKQKFGAELMSPAAFGWLSLYADPADGDPDPTSPVPEVVRIDSHKGGTFQGRSLDLERFNVGTQRESGMYAYITTPDLQPGLGNNGNRLNFYTYSYGPYTLQPGESKRVIVAEVAGVMDYNTVIAGRPRWDVPGQHHRCHRADGCGRPAGSRVGLRRRGRRRPARSRRPRAAAGARDGRRQRLGRDGGGGHRGHVGQGGRDGDHRRRIGRHPSTTAAATSPATGSTARPTSSTSRTPSSPSSEAPRGRSSSTSPKPTPRSTSTAELGKYRYEDRDVQFGRRYGYYVQAYSASPRPWTSANGTVVQTLPELASGDYNRSAATSAIAGPVASFDVYALPNPFVYGDATRSFGLEDPYRIEFRNLPERATIRIYTIAGDLVRTIEHGPDARGNLSGTRNWDQKSDSGLLVAPGIYVFNVTSDSEQVSGRLTGKLIIIR